MTNTNINEWTHTHERAALHVAKELGPYMGVAVARSNWVHVLDAAIPQLEIAGWPRDENNLIKTGVLDLTKLGLTKEEAAHRAAELNGKVAEEKKADDLKPFSYKAKTI